MTLFRYSITVALILLFRILSVAQSGPRWEVPASAAHELIIETIAVAVLLILGWIGCLRARKRESSSLASFIVPRIMIVAVGIFFVVVVTTVAPHWKIQHPELSMLASRSFVPGLIFSAAAFYFLSVKFK